MGYGDVRYVYQEQRVKGIRDKTHEKLSIEVPWRDDYVVAMFTYDPFSGLKFKHYYRKNKRNDD